MGFNPLRVGVIGASSTYGWARNSHLPALIGLPDLELLSVCTAHEKTASESAEIFGVRNSFYDYRDMLKDPDLDAVVVSVRVPYHHQLTMDVLRAGKHVYTEWPLGSNSFEAKQMSEFAKSAKVKNMVGLQARAEPVFLMAKEMLEDGYVGEVLSSRMTLFAPGILSRTSLDMWQSNKGKGANTFTILFGHALDALCMCLGEVREISAILSTQVDKWEAVDTRQVFDVDSPDNVLVHGILETGSVISMHVATVPWHGSGYCFEIYGSMGTLVLEAPNHVQLGNLTLRGSNSKNRELTLFQIPDRFKWIPCELQHGTVFNVAQMWRKFAESIRTGKSIQPDFDLAVHRHVLMDAIERASYTGERQIL